MYYCVVYPTGVLLGDGGYPLREWLMTPLLDPVTAAEQGYNEAHRSCRSTIERCNGMLKRRFHCLDATIR